MTIVIETSTEIPEDKAAHLIEMIGAMVAVDKVFQHMLVKYDELSLDEIKYTAYGKEIREAKRNGTFPQVEITNEVVQ